MLVQLAHASNARYAEYVYSVRASMAVLFFCRKGSFFSRRAEVTRYRVWCSAIDRADTEQAALGGVAVARKPKKEEMLSPLTASRSSLPSALPPFPPPLSTECTECLTPLAPGLRGHVRSTLRFCKKHLNSR